MSTNKYYSGQGSLYVAERDALTGKAKHFLPVGNVPELSLSIETTQFEHKESESGNRLIDLVLTTEKRGTFTFLVENLNMRNLALGFWGEDITVTAGTGVEDTVIVEEGLSGVRLALTHPKVSNVVVKDTATGLVTYVAGDDYTVDADNGVITIVPGGDIATAAASDDFSLEVTYDHAQYIRMDAFTNVVAPERWLRFEGINTVDGKKVIVDIFRAQFSPLTDYGLINEELGSGSLSGQIIADPLRVSGSQFFRQLDLA